MKFRILAFSLASFGCASAPHMTCYEGGGLAGLCVVRMGKYDMQKVCAKGGATVNDNGARIGSDKIAACYDKSNRTIYLDRQNQAAIYHELCHFGCNPDKVTLCDVKCDSYDDEPMADYGNHPGGKW